MASGGGGGSSSSASGGAVGGSSNPSVVTKNVMGVHAVSGGGARRKAWDDEHVLKRKFSALIPAFDPRPGRTNVPQTSDIVVAPPAVAASAEDVPSSVSASPPPEEGKASPLLDPSQPRLQLCLRGPNLPGIVDVEIDLNEPEWTIFRAVQYVMQVRNQSKIDALLMSAGFYLRRGTSTQVNGSQTFIERS